MLCCGQVVLSRLPIGDVATQYFADRDMFCAGRVPEDDLKRTMKACGGSIVTTAHDLGDKVLGQCGAFEERQVGGDRWVIAPPWQQLWCRFECLGLRWTFSLLHAKDEVSVCKKMKFEV